MTVCLCMTNLLVMSNLRREDIKYSYPLKKTMSCFQIICIVQVTAGLTAEASEFEDRGVKAL